jgi:hypothetical protein
MVDVRPGRNPLAGGGNAAEAAEGELFELSVVSAPMFEGKFDSSCPFD